MSQRKDYYKILGITDEEKELQGEEFDKILKKKFRKLSLQYHPDRNLDDKEAEEKFKDVNEAYDGLHNHREEYDNPTSNFKSPFEGMDISEILRGFNPFGFNPFNPFGMGDDPVVQGGNININLVLSLEQLFEGEEKKIKYKRKVVCKKCNGSGMDEHTVKKTCNACGGTGQIYRQNGYMQMITTCSSCGGIGFSLENPCEECGGSGMAMEDVEAEFEIQKGARDGQVIIIPDKGNAPPKSLKNGKNGSLFVHIHEAPHPIFTRDRDDLYIIINVGIIDAILGCEKEVKTIDGKTLSVKIPSGSNQGHQLLFKGYGMPRSNGGGKRGDLIGRLNLLMPKKLNEEAKNLLKEAKKKIEEKS